GEEKSSMTTFPGRHALLAALLLAVATPARADFGPSLNSGTWRLTGGVSATVCARGHCQTQRTPVSDEFVVADNQGAVVAVIPGCPGIQADELAGIATLVGPKKGVYR